MRRRGSNIPAVDVGLVESRLIARQRAYRRPADTSLTAKPAAWLGVGGLHNSITCPSPISQSRTAMAISRHP